MTDFAKIQKLLNICSSANDAEALTALRLVQKISAANLGDFLFSAIRNPADDSNASHLNALFEAEAEKFQELQQRHTGTEKSLRKRERENIRLKRDNKDLAARLRESEQARSVSAESAAKSGRPGEYEALEKLYEAEIVENDRLKMQLAEKDKFVRKGLRDVSKLKRGKGSNEDRVAELEKMVDDLALELMDYKDRERARKALPKNEALS